MFNKNESADLSRTDSKFGVKGVPICLFSVIIGTGAAPLWTAKCTYLTQIGVWYARITGATKDATVNLFFGVFFMTFQTSKYK